MVTPSFLLFTSSALQEQKGESVNLVEFTFKIQIFGTVDNLSDHLGVHF